MADSKKYNGSTWEHSLRKLTTATDTITTLPVDLYTDGNSATVGLVGNMYQASGVSPTNPIQPSECGERTAQLYFKKLANATINADGSITSNNSFDCYLAKVEANKQYIGTGYVYSFFVNEPYIGSGVSYDSQRVVAPASNGFTSPIDGYVAVRHTAGATDEMLNTGSTIKPYEPYGYKIPISSANTTTPVYLGEVETTRKIKKVTLTGNETFTKNDNQSTHYLYYASRATILPSSMSITPVLCNELPVKNDAPQTVIGISTNNTFGVVYFNFGADVMNAQPSGNTVEGLKEYLSAQYAAGTPVTVWYVLTTPETAVVNEPLRKIGEYVDTVGGITIPTITGKDTFDVLTTLKPSEVSLTYTDWHNATVKEWNGSEWQ